ncbi:disease resistance protein RPP2B-like [Mangifera indica]|uniref:disease resistance protein RPP2B-like n=1 Tax=Mangifera indica TaxID=29780 RepID=UPI001CFB9A09|nr:disease resistance protein RPP2B-like [Mangifera indica]
MASSSSSSITPKIKYEVFLSFCGVDTRKKITSHLYEAFCQKKIKTFIDDNLIRGEEISPSLLKAIEHSKISVIIFSKGYPASRWCLKELEVIVKCKNKYDQIVIPVFYEVDPSDVRNQRGDFGIAFGELEKRFMDDLKMLQRWRTALRDAANLSGFDSKNYRNEASLVNNIVDEILRRLDYDSSIIHTNNLVGLDSSIEEIENLLCTKGVCKIGIWGIGGIGKTTLATTVFNKIFGQFEASYFIENIREELEKSRGLNDMRQKLSHALLGDIHPNIGFIFPRERLSRKKVLIVFDDVTANLKQMDFLMKVFDYLNSESRIIITTRDKQVLANCGVHHIHEMKGLAFDKAFQLFTQYAFTESNPAEDYIGLSTSVVACVEGLPLALKVLGSFLFKRTKREWESALKNLKSINTYGDIQKVLKVSYEGLHDREKDIFLDIACFFKGYKRDLIEAILNARDLDSHIYINVLIERSLIITSFDTITMHDLLEEMGRAIVQQESIDDPGKRSRLWDYADIFSVLKYNTGTRAIRSIRLDMSKVAELHLNHKAFNNMQNLRFLEFYGSEPENKVFESDSSALCHNIRLLKKHRSKDEKKVHGFEVLKFNFFELRYFCWDKYPAKSLPHNFNPKNLVALYMRYSKVKKLWTGNQKLVNLKHIDLSHSKRLCRMPDFSLIPNLESLILEDCTNLLESFSSIHNLHKLIILNLQGCKGFDNLPISVYWKSLQEVNLSNCSNLKTVPYLPCTVEKLYLNGTSIKELLSIEHLYRLVKLSLRKCSRLERLPESIHELKSLKCLYLSGCTKLNRLPNDLGTLTTLEELELEEIALANIPTFVTSLINLKTLSFAKCKMQNRSSIPLIHLSIFQKMTKLNLVDCCIEVLPNNIGELLSLEYLYLDQNKFESLPVSIKDLSKLQELYIRNCQRLKSLSELPSNLLRMEAKNCISLESISGLPTIFLSMRDSMEGIDFINCFKLKFDVTDALLNIERNADVWYRLIDNKTRGTTSLAKACICYPGSEIPKWFALQSNTSFIEFLAGWLNDNLIGFALCVAVSLQDYQQLRIIRVGFSLAVNEEIISSGRLFISEGLKGEVIESDHVFVGYDYSIMSLQLLTLNLNSEGSIVFFVEHVTKNGNVISFVNKCGVTLLHAKDDDLRRDLRVDRDKRLNTINCSINDCLKCCLNCCEEHDQWGSLQGSYEILNRWSPHSEIYKQWMVHELICSELKKYIVYN